MRKGKTGLRQNKNKGKQPKPYARWHQETSERGRWYHPATLKKLLAVGALGVGIVAVGPKLIETMINGWLWREIAGTVSDIWKSFRD